jgi:hypothetical protein
MTFEDDLKLYRETYPKDFVQRHADWSNLVWELEKTVEMHPERWGWAGKQCFCGEPAESWCLQYGYLCRVHFLQAPLKMDPAEELALIELALSKLLAG